MVNCLLQDTSKGTVIYYYYSTVHREQLSYHSVLILLFTEKLFNLAILGSLIHVY